MQHPTSAAAKAASLAHPSRTPIPAHDRPLRVGDRVGRHRTLLLIDIENILGSGRFTAGDVQASRRAIGRAVSLREPSQVVVGASSGDGMLEAGLGWPGARLVWIPGRDGADLALADVALHENIATRFGGVVIGSGDGMFAVVARHLAAHHMHVTVVAGAGRLSAALKHYAHDVRLIGQREIRVA